MKKLNLVNQAVFVYQDNSYLTGFIILLNLSLTITPNRVCVSMEDKRNRSTETWMILVL